MNPNQIIALIVRLFAIFILLTSIRNFFGYYTYYGTDEVTSEHVFLIMYVVFLFIISVLMWKFPFTISKHIYSPQNEYETKVWSKDEVYIAGFVIVGIYYLYYVISDILYWSLYIITINRFDKNLNEIGPHEISSMITTGFELIIALALILGASGLKNIIFKIRYSGIYKR